jgi:hypothetical protein
MQSQPGANRRRCVPDFLPGLGLTDVSYQLQAYFFKQAGLICTATPKGVG